MSVSGLWHRVTARMTPNIWASLAFVAITAIGIFSGISVVAKGIFPTLSTIHFQFFNGPDRLTFPVVAAIVGGYFFAAECKDRYIANTRSRADIRKYILRLAIQAMLRVFIGYAFVAISYGIVAYALVPSIFPGSIEVAARELSNSAKLLDWDASVVPLSYFSRFGWPVHVAASAIWIGLQAATFALVSIVSVFLIRRTILALSVPFLIYIGESFITQFLDRPGLAFLSISTTPGGLSNFELAPAIFVWLALLIPTLLAFIILLIRSVKSPRFS